MLFLILMFFNAAAQSILLGGQFVAMILVIVYVGAVAVLFLVVILFIELVFLVSHAWVAASANGPALAAPAPMLSEISNTRALGQLLYTHYLYIFQVSGLILLVAMIGAIGLTLRQ